MGVRILSDRDGGKQGSRFEWPIYLLTSAQTFYLTLDLSVPDFLERNERDVVPHTRGGYKIWYNSLYGPGGTGTKAPKDRAEDVEGGGENDDEDSVLRRIDRTASQPSSQQISKTATQPESLGDIQILELHSDSPIAMYRGKYFVGSWAETIGTELIFTGRQENSSIDSGDNHQNTSTGADCSAPLPALRHLPEDIDLLAASSSRLEFRPVVAQPQPGFDPSATQRHEVPSREERYAKEGAVYIPIHADTHGQRRPQADFLEDLTALKRKRGEMDLPTTVLDGLVVEEQEGDKEEFNELWYMRRRAKPAERRTAAGMSTGTGTRTGTGPNRRTVLPRGRPPETASTPSRARKAQDGSLRDGHAG